MNKLKVSQVQFSASHLPNFNSRLLEQNFNKAIKFKPHLICTPECSNIITNDKNYLMLNAPYQNSCPVLKMAKDFAKKNKVFGSIDFINGNKMFLSESIHNHVPKVGDVILFPNYLSF